MNSYTKWLVSVLVGIILAGAGWNETHQWQVSNATAEKTQQNAQDIAAMKQAVIDTQQTSKDNNEKLDKAIRKLDVIIDQQKR